MSYPPFIQSRAHKHTVGNGAGDHTGLTSGTPASFAASAYSLTLNNLQIGDVIAVHWSCSVYGNSDDKNRFFVDLNSGFTQELIYRQIIVAANETMDCDVWWFHELVSGDINNGNVEVEILYSITGGGTMSVGNNSAGSDKLPHLDVWNIGPQDTT